MSKKNTTTQVQINFTYAGIDVSKRWLDLCAPGLSGRFENSKAGLAKLARALLRSCRGGLPPLAVLEASGGYERLCLDTLEEAGIAFRLLNPRRARDFANASGRLAKTDAIDAATLAELGASLRLEVREIAGLEVRRDAVLGDIHAEGCRLEKSVGSWVAEPIKAHLRSLAKELAAIDARIAERIAADPLLAAKNATMQSVCGVGPRVSASLLANVPELGSLGRKASASLAGLAPFNRDSGQFRGQRTCHGGRSRGRRSLYMAALVAARHNTHPKPFSLRLLDAGKPKKLALIAVARKLVIHLGSLIKPLSNTIA